MIESDQIESITAADVRSKDDEKIGSVGQIFLDGQTGRPEWAAVRTGLFGTKEAFVPLRNAEWDGRVVRIAYDKERVRNAPHVEPDTRGLDPDQQTLLYTYYGFTEASAAPGATAEHDPRAFAARSPGGAEHDADTADDSSDLTDTRTAAESVAAAPSTPTVPPFGVTVPPQTDRAVLDDGGADDETDTDAGGAAITRMEERLEVAVERHPTERVRLRKHVVTQQETVTVTVRREELRIERSPITPDEARKLGAGQSIDESGTETEIVLYEERPVVTTVIRPVERIRLTRELVVDEQTVTGDVRKERVEVEDHAIDR